MSTFSLFNSFYKEDPPTDINTLVFTLSANCMHPKKSSKSLPTATEKPINSSVYSSQLTWVPQGEQSERMDPIKPVHDDILLLKMRPGHELDLQIHCEKGIGKDHAKFSPVALCSYRLLPKIVILKPVLGDEAKKFQECFPKGVIKLVKNKDGVMQAEVDDVRKDTVTREVLRHEEFKDKVLLQRVRDHFLCKYVGERSTTHFCFRF